LAPVDDAAGGLERRFYIQRSAIEQARAPKHAAAFKLSFKQGIR
jgi:hypothetical protein